MKPCLSPFFRSALRAVIGLLLLLVTAAGATGQQPDPGPGPGNSPAILYIEANTGDSSGGHAGIRIGNQVFHYQYGNRGWLVLRRESWDQFRRFYNDLGNRAIFAARLDLPAKIGRRIHDRFTLELLCQDARRQQLTGARDRVRLLAALAAGRPLPRNLRAAGFFQPETGSGGPAAARLKRIVGERLGENFICDRCRKLRRALSRPPESTATFVSWHEQRSRLAALEAIDRELGLRERELVAVPAGDRKPDLTPRERTRLREIKQNFRETVIRLLDSRRPDNGFPLLLALARYLACARSLGENRLLLLNSRPPQAETIDPLYQAGNRRLLGQLACQSLKLAADRRLRLFQATGRAAGRLSEFAWCRLENAATRGAGLAAAAAGRPRLQVFPGNPLPARPGSGFLRQPFSRNAARKRLARAKADLKALTREFDRRYGYNLFTRNCVTELFTTLARALPPLDAAGSGPAFDRQQRQLINSISFIPWRMFNEVIAGLHPAAVTGYPSLRQRYLADRYRRENDLLVYLKECNTLTSPLYRAGGQDDSFLLFTGEAGLARPLFGAVNLAWALPRTAFGLLSWPFDDGRALKKGFYGTLFSLPELFFVSLRKGSFVVTPAAATTTEKSSPPRAAPKTSPAS